LLVKCFNSKKIIDSKDRITSVVIVSDFPYYIKGVGIQNEKDSIIAYYLDSSIMFQIPYNFDSSNNSKFISTQKRYDLFIYKERCKYGLSYDPFKDISKILLVDSTITKFAFGNLKFSIEKLNKPFTSTLSIDQGTLIDKYIKANRNNMNEADTSIFYYSKKLKHLKYSLSNELDSLKGMKLYKLEMISNTLFDEGNNILIPQRVFYIEVKENNNIDEKRVLEVFKKYNKERAKNNTLKMQF
jgi:hypothetical protein